MSTIALPPLPDFAFLDGQTPDGDTLEHRRIILYTKQPLLLEAANLADPPTAKEKKEFYNWTYQDPFLGIQYMVFIIHMEPKNTDIQPVLKKAEIWYKHYLDWYNKQRPYRPYIN